MRGLVFLGNRDGNDDIFHFGLETRQLTALTRTPFSEKGFTMRAAGAAFEIETRSLWKAFRYRFDPRQPVANSSRNGPWPGRGRARRP